MESDPGLLALYILSFISLLVVLFFNFSGVFNLKIFRNRLNEVSDRNKTWLTPPGYVFAIWSLIYIFQLAWQIYALTTLGRTNGLGPIYINPVVMPVLFHVFYIITGFGNVGFLFAFDREKFVLSSLSILIVDVFGWIALGINCVYTKEESYQISRADLISIYVLVQNGLALYFTWTIVAFCVSLAITFQYTFKLSAKASAITALTVLVSVVIVLGVLDLSLFFSYSKYIFSAYLVLIWALVGVTQTNFNTSCVVTWYKIIAIILSVALLVAKIVMVATE